MWFKFVSLWTFMRRTMIIVIRILKIFQFRLWIGFLFHKGLTTKIMTIFDPTPNLFIHLTLLMKSKLFASFRKIENLLSFSSICWNWILWNLLLFWIIWKNMRRWEFGGYRRVIVTHKCLHWYFLIGTIGLTSQHHYGIYFLKAT